MTETLEQFAERIARETRSALMSKLDDDVIGQIKDSHLIFGKACVMAAISLAGGPQKPSPAQPLLHDYQPHPKWPWFCAECGYPEHERLKHAAQSQSEPHA